MKSMVHFYPQPTRESLENVQLSINFHHECGTRMMQVDTRVTGSGYSGEIYSADSRVKVGGNVMVTPYFDPKINVHLHFLTFENEPWLAIFKRPPMRQCFGL